MRAESWHHLEIIDRCLDEIDASDRFFVLLGPKLGTNTMRGSRQLASSFIELELFYAVITGKPIYVFRLKDSDQDSDLSRLLDTLTTGARETQTFVGLQTDIVAEIARQIDRKRPTQPTSKKLSEILSGYLAQRRHSDFGNAALFQEIEFLRGQPAGATQVQPDFDLVRECISDLRKQERTDRKMSRAWLAIRLLMGRHYRDEKDIEILGLWEEVMRAWSQFAGWRGLHSHLWLGHIASLGSLYQITQRREISVASPTSDEHGGNLFGAFASVYYSLSKVARKDHRDSFRARSLAYLNMGLESVETRDRQGLYAIRAALRLNQKQFQDSIQDFESALGIAESTHAEPGAVAILQADLGFAEVQAGNLLRGRNRLEAAVEQIVKSDAEPGFKVRSLRKLAVSRFLTLSPVPGFMAARDAARLIERHGVLDQQDQMTQIAAKIDRLLRGY